MVGYRRFEGLEAAALLAQLYRSARLFVNCFQPSFKLIRKERERVSTKRTAPPRPHISGWLPKQEHLMPSARANEIYAGLDPVALPRDIRSVQEQLANLTDAAPARHLTAMPPIEQFLSSLRIAWKDGADARPTGQLRSRSESGDALIRSSKLRHSCANGSRPSRGGPAANSCPSFRQKTRGVYPRKVLRTFQPRLRLWRSEQASATCVWLLGKRRHKAT